MKPSLKQRKDAINSLYNAVIAYVEANGGSVAAIGGLALVEESSRQFNYGVMCRVTGKRPKFPPTNSKKGI